MSGTISSDNFINFHFLFLLESLKFIFRLQLKMIRLDPKKIPSLQRRRPFPKGKTLMRLKIFPQSIQLVLGSCIQKTVPKRITSLSLVCMKIYTIVKPLLQCEQNKKTIKNVPTLRVLMIPKSKDDSRSTHLTLAVGSSSTTNSRDRCLSFSNRVWFWIGVVHPSRDFESQTQTLQSQQYPGRGSVNTINLLSCQPFVNRVTSVESFSSPFTIDPRTTAGINPTGDLRTSIIEVTIPMFTYPFGSFVLCRWWFIDLTFQEPLRVFEHIVPSRVGTSSSVGDQTE